MNNFIIFDNYRNTQLFFWLLFCILCIYLIPEALYATSTTTTAAPNAIFTVVCNVVAQLTGPIGQAVSTIAVIFIGIGLFMGKISWGLALGIAIGMALLFGAENIVGWIGGDTAFACVGGTV